MSESDVTRDETTTTGSWYPSSTQVTSGPVLVATDGSPAGEAAFRAAALIAGKLSSKVHVVVVVEPLPMIVPEPSAIMQPLVASPELLDAVRDGVVRQMRDLAPEGSEWNVEVEYGRPSDETARKAADTKAQLIVIGLVHHGLVDRILDGDTALEVVRQANVPVMLASPDAHALPKRAIFAVDFSPQSMDAARAALRVLDDSATITLVHVRPAATVFDGSGLWEEEYEQAATRELEKFTRALGAPAATRVEATILQGGAAKMILELAQKSNADLVVAGTHGAGLMQRLFLGSVATRLIRHADCSLLIVPDQQR